MSFSLCLSGAPIKYPSNPPPTMVTAHMPPSDDYTLITQSVSAANQFCSRRRAEAGYNDNLTTSPSGDVTLGTLMYGAALWRSRGSLENVFASFDNMGTAPQQSLTPIVKQLLGIDRPAVA